MTLASALAAGPVVLDGGLATELEAQGHDLSSRLWSARLLVEEPAAVEAAHAAYLAAGAQVVSTASYQATFEGFAAAGLDADATERLLRRSVELARRATDAAGRGLVAASVGPYGALLADGSEYTGAYPDEVDVAALRAWHRPRLEVLAGAGADVLACETVPSAAEAEALLEELGRLGHPAWLSLTLVVDPSGVVRTRRGERAAEVLAAAGEVGAVVAVGVNCTAPGDVLPAVGEAARSGKPVVAYPNSGESWDAAARRWTGRPGLATADVVAWRDAGARLVGGCCRVGPADVRALAAALSS